MEHSANDYEGSAARTDDVRLSESISLIGELAKKIFDKTSEYFPKDDISKSEKLILQCLINRDGVNQLDIVKFTGFKPPTISIMIHKMQDQGLVSRKPDEYDLRAMRVFITDKGRETYNEAVRVIKLIEGKLLKGLTSSEKEAMVSAMKKIRNNLEEF